MEALDQAANDSRVQGIYADMESAGYALAHIQEMRAAIKRFRKSGKFAYIYSTSYGEAGGLGAYYLASAFDEIWMQPLGTVSLPGLSAEMPFLRGVLDKVGVKPEFFQRKNYKTAYEGMTNKEMSKYNREMTEQMIGDIAAILEEDISADVPAVKGKFKKLVDHALFTAPEAKKAGIVHQVAYADMLQQKVSEKLTGKKDGDVSYVDLGTYFGHIAQAGEANPLMPSKMGSHKGVSVQKSGKGIGLVYASGMIVPREASAGAASPMGMLDDGIAAADKISGALLDAALDDSIGIVVLRVDSPGGSPVASETILRAVAQVQAQGKKVIVSMGPTAASGGYWISAYADRIFVLPTTITGSIGVLGGKFSTQQLWKNLDVNWDGVVWGKNAGLWSMNKPFSESQSERINAMLDDVYVNFIARVAKGRKMSPEAVEKIAGGHVWMGKRAVEIGLADEIGGLDRALDYAAQELGLKSRAQARVAVFPKPLTPLEQLLEILQGQAEIDSFSGAQSLVREFLRPVVLELEMARNPQNFGVYNRVGVR